MLWQELRQARDEFVAAHGEHSVSVLSGENVTLADLPQLLQGSSLFVPQKLTIIRDMSANKPVWEKLGDFLESADDVDLLLVESKPDKRTRTFKWLTRHAKVQEYRLLDEREAAAWCEAEADRQGVRLGRDAARFLVEYCGTDQWVLRGSIEKLALAGQPATVERIKSIVDPHPSASVFALLDAMLSRRREEALEMLRIIRGQEDPYKFMGLLASQLYTLAVIVHGGERSPQTIAKESSQHPYVVQKLSRLSRQLDADRVQELVRRARACDRSLKSSGSEPWTIIEAMIGAS